MITLERECLKADNIREVQESKTEVVWTCEEARTTIGRKKDCGDGTTREKKRRKTEAEMDGLCKPRQDEVHDRTGWRRIVSAAASIIRLRA